jgi:hypothetical protein
MTGLHASLTVRSNLLMCALTGPVAIGLSFMGWPKAAVITAIGAAFGLVVGILQARALREASAALAAARDSLAVRSALSATKSGSLAIRVQWAALIPVLVVWILPGGQPFLAPIAAYAALMFVRDVTTLPALAGLARYAVGEHV